MGSPKDLRYPGAGQGCPLGLRLWSQELSMEASRTWSGFTRAGHRGPRVVVLRAGSGCSQDVGAAMESLEGWDPSGPGMKVPKG